MIRQQILTRVLGPEREAASRGYSATFEARPIRIKNRPDYSFLEMVELPLTLGRFLRLQMLRFFLLRIGHRLGTRRSATDSSCILRRHAKRTRNPAGNKKNGELSG